MGCEPQRKQRTQRVDANRKEPTSYALLPPVPAVPSWFDNINRLRGDGHGDGGAPWADEAGSRDPAGIVRGLLTHIGGVKVDGIGLARRESIEFDASTR